MWSNDLIEGNLFEDVVTEMLRKKHPDVHRSSGYEPGYDIKAGPLTIECKYDRLAGSTENIAIEIAYKSKPSGICTTQATHWVLKYYKQSYLVISVNELRQIVRNTKYRRVRGGDGFNSLLVLVPVRDLRPYHDDSVMN